MAACSKGSWPTLVVWKGFSEWYLNCYLNDGEELTRREREARRVFQI